MVFYPALCLYLCERQLFSGPLILPNFLNPRDAATKGDRYPPSGH